MVVFVLAVFGLIFGSFVSAVVYRLHEQAELADKKTKSAAKRRQELSISKGRSMCPNCGHTLAAKDLVPVFSWLALRGKCRYCHARIPDSPLVEIAMAVLFIVSYLAWPLELHGVGLFRLVVWLGFVVAFMALAVYDIRWYLLPDKLVLPLIVVALVETIITTVWLHDIKLLWEPVLAAVLFFGLFWVLYQVSGGAWIGGGDVKLALLLGLLAGTPLGAFMVLFFSSLLGTAASVPLLIKGKKGLKVHIPFGPYLLLATFIVVLYGDKITHWYQNLLV